jgi:hypothetical protein
MAMKVVRCMIKGLSSLLMHRYPAEPIEALEKKPPEEQAELAVYRSPDGELYFPGLNIQRSLVSAATFSKGKGRATLQRVVAACVFVSPEYCLLGAQKYIVDSRPVVIPATRGRVVRHRPRFDDWRLSFELSYDDTLLTEPELRRVVDDAGNRIGIGDFRPERKGPFGRFIVIEWKS